MIADLRALLREGARLWHDARQIPRMILNPKYSQSHYPSEPRKSKPRIAVDLLAWLLRYREFNEYYYVYGFDRRDANMDQYLSHRAFRRIRNSRNYYPAGGGCNYICLLQDKFVFSQFVSSLGFPTPKNLAIVDQASVTWLSPRKTAPLEDLLRDEDLHFDAFCKRLSGLSGKGAFPLRLRDRRLFINDEAITPAQLKDRLQVHQYLIQERVRQHATMSELHPPSLNTIRLMTFNNGGTVRVFSAGLKVGANGQNLDNWSAGGILVGIDRESGRLRGEGLFKPGYGSKVREHPQTGVRFSGFEIPYFHDAVELAVRLHGYFYAVHSIGWDIAITDRGPLIIEGNDNWGGHIPMALEQNFKQRFLEMYRA